MYPGQPNIGTYNIWPRSDINFVIICIYGDANYNTVLNESKCENAQIIVNTTLDPNLSLKIAGEYKAKKQILSVNNSSSFDIFTSTTYGRAAYTIDSQQVEGITLSQIIYCWAYTNVRNNLENQYKQKHFDLNLFKRELLKECNKYKPKNKRIYDNSKLNDLRKYLMSSGKGKILIC
jgi:hypothetical protein